MQFKDYYETLGVAKDASADDIKKAFRKLARKYHPDVSKEADAQDRMREVNEANAVLSDPEKRAAYDALGSQPHGQQDFRPPPNWDAGYEFSGPPGDGGGDYSAFFEELFGRAARQAGSRQGGPGGAHGQRREAPTQRGTDHHASIELELVDAYNGAERHITLRGARLDDTGHVATEERTLSVKIPKGVFEGLEIRLGGQGGEGLGGAAAGDLFLVVHFKPDTRYRVQGRDVTASLPLAPWEAALGAQIEVPTPVSRVQVSVPAGWKKGRKLRLKGHGIPGRSATDPAGDMYLELELTLPPVDSDRARELFATLARDLPYDPRAGM